MVEKKKNLVKSKNALQTLAGRLCIDQTRLKQVLMSSVCKEIKNENEFAAFVVVANSYKLNPLTKEIYAFPDKKGNGIIPIVSTDGWNKLMTTHPEYKNHYYEYSEESITIETAKPCPEWMEIHIVKKDGSEIKVREYLDECFNGNKKDRAGKPYQGPWDTHTKRMLRHKTKIQGAREAFGFGGIYDHDEAERIIEAEATVIDDLPQVNGKPLVSLPETTKPGANNAYKDMLNEFQTAKGVIGEDKYYEVLTSFGFEKSNQVKTVSLGKQILTMMSKVADELEKKEQK